MLVYRIYTKAKRGNGKAVLRSTHYREPDAMDAARAALLKGLWVSMTTREEEEPNRWD